MLVYNHIIKRDGKQERFDATKIMKAIKKASEAENVEIDYVLIKKKIIHEIEQLIVKKPLGIEEIQDKVELNLMKYYPKVAKAYILYRYEKNKKRKHNSY